jgi:hypothetical protein
VGRNVASSGRECRVEWAQKSGRAGAKDRKAHLVGADG